MQKLYGTDFYKARNEENELKVGSGGEEISER